jgi:hypothetical protein
MKELESRKEFFRAWISESRWDLSLKPFHLRAAPPRPDSQSAPPPVPCLIWLGVREQRLPRKPNFRKSSICANHPTTRRRDDSLLARKH